LAVGVSDTWPVAHGNLIASTRCIEQQCDLVLTETSNGQRRAVPLAGVSHSVAISPDGRTVAVAVQHRYRNAGDVALVDVATGSLSGWLRSAWISQTRMAWGRASDRLFLLSGFDRDVWMYDTRDQTSFEQLRLRILPASPFYAIAVM
jgi:hypothetical protein